MRLSTAGSQGSLSTGQSCFQTRTDALVLDTSKMQQVFAGRTPTRACRHTTWRPPAEPPEPAVHAAGGPLDLHAAVGWQGRQPALDGSGGPVGARLAASLLGGYYAG